LALISQLGLTIVVPILLGVVLGLFIDSHLGTRPWATLALIILGVIAGGVGVYRLISDSIQQDVAARQQHLDQDREHGP
jgi:F0F1-type ATP synthase assembly protein I